MNAAFEKDRPCGACQADMKVGAPHHAKNIMRRNVTYELVQSYAYISIGGNKYGLVIIDDYSCFTWVFFLQDKSESQEVLKNS
jgi:hypothetical protein